MSKLYEAGTDIVTLSYLRDMRDDLLQDCDWTQMPDSPLSDSKKTEWATYRQALRDLPSSYTNSDAVADIVWPTQPN